ncbi:T9SS type A sorting domain-containing protein [Polaribacter staleyi]|uniref:T9SS type A sorting domain-containing protein n=1 Tax=Polaribacter staleyi TaxID=2022337 RepID=UPI0031BB5FBA
MKNSLKIYLLGILSICFVAKGIAQIQVDVNLRMAHDVGGVDSFERSKYITLHSSQSENDFLDHLELMDFVINGLDVYMGREVGAQSNNLNQTNQDPLRPGFADIAQMKSLGTSYKSAYAAKTYIHQYENKNMLNISTHGVNFPFYPSGINNENGWAFANSSATAEWLAYYIKYFYGEGGQPTPKYFSIINEPEFINITPFSNLADYHNVIANKVRSLNPDIKLGGFTSAGPQFEGKPQAQDPETISNPGFSDWDKYWKPFIDIAGANMDYFDVHWYDSPFTGYQYLREGANLEASFDMLEQYSKLKLGVVKPFLVSEYGSFIENYEDEPYTKKRDWTNLKAFSAMLMNYLDRPNLIIKSVPFMVVKGAWGTNPVTGYPHPYRLLRQENGKWVFTEFVKFFQLWSDVKGTRVVSKPSDLDIQTETYVDGNKAYVILNNLNFSTKTININLTNQNNNPVQNVKIKHLYLGIDTPVLEETNSSTMVSSVDIHSESTMVLEYTFTKAIEIDQKLYETKYYADSYLKPILANQVVSFDINQVITNDAYGEAVLRVSFGRDHDKSVKPKVKFNGTDLFVPTNYRGYNMKPRFRWFGTLEIPIDYSLLQNNNTITIEFPDNGGHISTVTMQVYESSNEILNSIEAISIETKKINIFPNPAKKTVNINGASENNSVFIYNINGEIVLKGKVTNSGINISKLNNGVYMLSVVGENYIETQKLIIAH